MIHWFEVENYSSFLDAVRIDFAPGKVVDDNAVAVSPAGVRTSKLMGFFGPNAAGKTNLIRAVYRLAEFASLSFGWPESRLLAFKPHFFNPEQPARVALEFEVPVSPDAEPAIYRYEVEASEERVVSEVLRVKTSHLFSRVFERRIGSSGYEITGLGARHRDVPERVSFIAWLARHEIPEAKRLVRYFKSYQSNDSDMVGRVPLVFGLWSAIEAYRNDQLAHAKMVAMLQKWDFGLSDVEYVKRRFVSDEVSGEQEMWMAEVVHRRGDKVARLPILAESSGTAGLFTQLSRILPVLMAGGVAIVDELESDLHPKMVEVLLDLFLNPESNPHNAQMVFSTHADWVMNALNKWSTVLVEKRECNSTAWRLADMQGVQSRDNHPARYRAGAYGAIPRELDEGSKGS
jgi:putative AbiEii toxin of type IV toxin-antitoxin system